MSEDRALLEPEAAIAALRAELDDKISTLNARSGRLPTGSMLPTLAAAAPAGTLILNGQTVQRDQYPDLWAWTEATNAGGFVRTATTLQLPDYRGRVMRGTPAGEAVGLLTGADSRVLTVAQMPAHDHDVTVANHAQHDHNNSVSSIGNHGGHNAGSTQVASAIQGSQDFFFSVADTTQNGGGGHSHSVDIFLDGPTSHSVSQSPAGSGAPVDMRQASFNGNWLIWC